MAQARLVLVRGLRCWGVNHPPSVGLVDGQGEPCGSQRLLGGHDGDAGQAGCTVHVRVANLRLVGYLTLASTAT